jgi:hypothetical protein
VNRVSWGAALAAGLVLGVPMAAEAATPTSSPPTTPTAPSAPEVPSAPSTLSAPAPTSTTQSSTGSSATHSSDTTSTQAPPGSGEADAARVDDTVAVSHTKASASGSGASSTADPLELGGSNPPAPQFGGTQTGAGPSQSGALFDTGPSSQFRLALTPWQTTNTQSASGNRASGLADVVLLDLGDPTTSQSAYVRVLQSQSNATWTPGKSTGSSSSDGAVVNLGGPSGLTLDVLHSEATSSGTGNSYLISVNGTQIGSSSQANGQCVINVPPLLALSCLTASGGTAGQVTTAAAKVLTFTLGSGAQSLTAGAIESNSSSGVAAASSSPSPSAAPATVAPATSPAASAPAAAPAPSSPSSSLPFTGIDLAGWLGGALALSAAGGTIVWLARRRTPRPALDHAAH